MGLGARQTFVARSYSQRDSRENFTSGIFRTDAYLALASPLPLCVRACFSACYSCSFEVIHIWHLPVLSFFLFLMSFIWLSDAVIIVVHDQFMRHVMTTSNRFSDIRSLSLEGCNAITDQSLVVVSRECRYLRTLLLTECHRLSRDGLLLCIQRLPYLEKIELFGVTEDMDILDSIREIRPLMDFGSFWFLVRCHGFVRLT